MATSLNEKKAVRVAPVRSGVQRASAWRFWMQGDEFYAAQRTFIGSCKISFHRNGSWQYRMGSSLLRLTAGLKIAPGWVHALQIVFMIEDSVLLPESHLEENVRSITIPVGHKLLIDLIIADNARVALGGLPAQMTGGAVLQTLALRGGKIVQVVASGAPLSAPDRELVDEVRSKLKINFAQLPEPGEVYAEAMHVLFRPGLGNLICVIPVGTETLAVEPAPTQPG